MDSHSGGIHYRRFLFSAVILILLADGQYHAPAIFADAASVPESLSDRNSGE